MAGAINKDLKERLANIDKIREDLKKAEKSASKDIMNLLKELMVNNPLIAGIRWTQYTPHFNDGEPCEFSINDPEFKFNLGAPIKLEDEEDVYNNEGWYDDYNIDDDFFEKRSDIMNHKEIIACKKGLKDIQTVFEKLRGMEDTMESMFGDHMQITVTADGVETEEYDHD
jgi:hypothetical protein